MSQTILSIPISIIYVYGRIHNMSWNNQSFYIIPTTVSVIATFKKKLVAPKKMLWPTIGLSTVELSLLLLITPKLLISGYRCVIRFSKNYIMSENLYRRLIRNWFHSLFQWNFTDESVMISDFLESISCKN